MVEIVYKNECVCVFVCETERVSVFVRDRISNTLIHTHLHAQTLNKQKEVLGSSSVVFNIIILKTDTFRLLGYLFFS